MTYTVTDYAAVRRLRAPAARRGITRLEVIPRDGQPSHLGEAWLNQALRFSGCGWLGAGIAWMVYLGLVLGWGGPLLVDPWSQLLWGLLSLGGGLGLTHGLIWVYRELLWRQVLDQLERQFDRRRKPRLGSGASSRSHALRSPLEARFQPDVEGWPEPPARAISHPA
ncbi:MAG TPA: hypothetical protein VFS50_01615 [Meiothermus sp.]|jgi:hypothetical protein|nr:hypothetical protein [Meiothermus sp.]